MMKTYDSIVSTVTKHAVELCSPFRVYLVSEKRSSKGSLTGFKLCLIVSDDKDPDSVETELLINIDTPVPCDYIVYCLSDWNSCVDDDATFAYRIENSGELLYE